MLGDADITGLPASVFFDLERWAFWQLEPWLHRQLFAGNVAAGTLVYRREVWDQLARYPDTSLAEDADLLRGAIEKGARLKRIELPRMFIYVRHGENCWRLRFGEHADASAWRRIEETVVPACDATFYRQRAAARAPSAASEMRMTRRSGKAPRLVYAARRSGQQGRWPLVSCLLPTADRRELVPQVIAYFERLDYPNRELVIIDDGEDAMADLVPADERLRYIRLDASVPLGEERNVACEVAAGDLLAHWDDDDWYAPWRLSYQLRELQAARADVAGLATMRFYDPERASAWLYQHPDEVVPWAAGATLCYTRAFWEGGAFPSVEWGEDDSFVARARPEKVTCHERSDFAVAVTHAKNTTSKQVEGRGYRPIDGAEVRALLAGDFGFYQTLGRVSRALACGGGDPIVARCVGNEDSIEHHVVERHGRE